MLGALVLLQLAQDGGFFSSVGDIAFVIRLMALVYVVFWLYQTFAESQILFGLATLGAGYFILFASNTFVALAIVVLLMVMGMWLQQSIQFGLLPLLGVGMGGGGGEDFERLQQKIQAGAASQEEMQYYNSVAQQQDAYSQNYLRQMGMRRH